MSPSVTTQAAGHQNRAMPFFWLGGLIVVIAIFSRELAKGSVYGIDVDWFAYPAYIIFFSLLLLTAQVSFNKKLLVLFGYLILSAIYSKPALGLTWLPFIKQMLPIILIYSTVAWVIPRVGVDRIFKWYVKLAYFSAWIGIIQFLLHAWNYSFDAPIFQLMVDSIAEEPSHYAVIVLPALIYTFINRRSWYKEFIVLLAVIVLTFNLTAYTVFGLCLLIIYRRLGYLLVLLPLLTLLGFYLYDVMPTFHMRIDGMWLYVITQSLESLHGTPLSFLYNFQVAMETLKLSPLLGSGLGGHEEMYYRYFNLNEFSRLDYLFGLNAKSAHSLSIRIISELGLIGLIGYLWLLSRPLLIKRNSIFYAISIGCLSHFLCKTLKLGNYFDLGTPFFLLIIIFSYTAYRAEIKN